MLFCWHSENTVKISSNKSHLCCSKNRTEIDHVDKILRVLGVSDMSVCIQLPSWCQQSEWLGLHLQK